MVKTVGQQISLTGLLRPFTGKKYENDNRNDDDYRHLAGAHQYSYNLHHGHILAFTRMSFPAEKTGFCKFLIYKYLPKFAGENVRIFLHG